MTEAGWTRGKDVKVEGWYWWEVEEETGLSLKVVQVEKGFTWIESEGRDVLYVVGYGGLLENKPGRFKGPITPGSYQQGRVAAFKQSIEKLREREQFYTEQEAISEGQMRMTRGLQRNESSCCIHELEKLAQAAQDEKGVGG